MKKSRKTGFSGKKRGSFTGSSRGDGRGRDSNARKKHSERHEKTFHKGHSRPWRNEGRPPRHDDRPYDDRPRGDKPEFRRDFRKKDFRKKDFGGHKPWDKNRGGRDFREDHRNREDKPRRERLPLSGTGQTRQGTHLNVSIFGFHAVREAWLNPRRMIRALYLTAESKDNFQPVLNLAREKGLERPNATIVQKDDLDRALPRETVHQGIALDAADLDEIFIQDMINAVANKERAVFVMLDQVTDPHNVGAILRSACAFGAQGIILQRRHAPEMTGTLAKAASGAVEHVPVAYETNLNRTIEVFKEAGYTVAGLDERGQAGLNDLKRHEKLVIVLGAEGHGMRHLVKRNCDLLVALPTKGPIASLNVSNAAAVALYAASA